MKFSIATLIIFGLIFSIEAIPQRGGGGRRGGGGGRRGGGGGRRGSPGGRDGLKGPFEACEDEVSPDDLECGDEQKAMVFPEAACRDLSVGDEFPSKREIKDNNPCVEAEVYLSFFINIILPSSIITFDKNTLKVRSEILNTLVVLFSLKSLFEYLAN